MQLTFPNLNRPDGAANSPIAPADVDTLLDRENAFALLLSAALDSSTEQCDDILASRPNSAQEDGLFSDSTSNSALAMQFGSTMERMPSVAKSSHSYDPTPTSEAKKGLPSESTRDQTAGYLPGTRPGSELEIESSSFNKDELSKWMDSHALTRSTHHCAMYCRKGLEAAGLSTTDRPSTGDAGDYGPYLLRHGAKIVAKDLYTPQVGDVVIFSKTSEHPFGHIEMYDGQRWVSDFKQQSLSPYRDANSAPPYTIYRLG